MNATCGCDCAVEVQRLRDREMRLILANNAELERRRGFEDEANQAHCETILLRGECIRLREANALLSSFIEECSADVPEALHEVIEAVFPPEVAAIVVGDDGTRVQSPSPVEVLDQAIELLWKRMEREEYGHAKAAVSLDIEALTELRGQLAQV